MFEAKVYLFVEFRSKYIFFIRISIIPYTGDYADSNKKRAL